MSFSKEDERCSVDVGTLQKKKHKSNKLEISIQEWEVIDRFKHCDDDVIQLVLQDTGTVTTENHPMHLHGYDFYVVAFGEGNYNPTTARLNLVDPPAMNTVAVPVGGWAVIRFVADNAGI